MNKKTLTKVFLSVLSLSLMVYSLRGVRAEETPQSTTAPVEENHKVVLYFFWGNGCPHCAAEKPFLDKLEKEIPNLEIRRYEVWYSSKNQNLMKKAAEALKANVSGVPFTIVGDQYVTGYSDEETTGATIREMVNKCSQDKCEDTVGAALGLKAASENTPEKPKKNIWENAPTTLPKSINVPLIGKVDLTKMSLPAIAIVIGTLDGFNPCALWTLLFLLSLLLGTRDRKRILVLGGGFIFISGLSYFLMMTAWLNALIFLGFMSAIRIAIGIFGLGAGAYNLKKYYDHKTGCIAENGEKRKKTLNKLKELASHKSLLVAFGGVAALAFAVNLIELLCSAGFPAIFTQILALNNVSPLGYYSLILLYLVFFLLDDLFIFFMALIAFKATAVSTKYAKWSHLFGGILMLIIGLLLIFSPKYLMFSF